MTRLAISDRPTEDEGAFLAAGLDRYNRDKTGDRYHFPGSTAPGLAFALAVKDPSGGVVGGITVSSILGVMWLEVLWVDEKHRGRGLASWLILEAERRAREAGCVGAGTWTFSWQGPQFYPKVGFKLAGIYEGYPLGMTEHVLCKRLPSSELVREAVARRARSNEQDGYTLIESPAKEEMTVVHQAFHEFCVEHAGAEMHNPGIDVRLVLRNEDGQAVGGLTASTTVRIIALEQIWISEPFRGHGWGRKLVAEAEGIARDHGCVAAQGSCLSFQSPGFFHRVGYTSFGAVDVYPDGVIEDLLIKRFTGSGSSASEPARR